MPSNLILKCQYNIEFSQSKIRHKNLKPLLKQLKSFVFLIDDKTTGILYKKQLKSFVFLLIKKQLKSYIIIKTTEIHCIFLSMIKQLESLLKKPTKIFIYFTDDKTTDIFE